MWCDKCQADVAAMASTDNERVYCTTCNSELRRSAAAAGAVGPRAADPSRKTLSDPRELLARWAREDALGSLDPTVPVKREPTVESKKQLRFDVGHPTIPPQSQFVERIVHKAPPAPHTHLAAAAAEPTDRPARDVVIHSPHSLHGPHFQPAPVPLADRSSKWMTLVGQLFAYFGVGGLFVGTVLVLMGYFSGPPSYATTGWLVTTAGQMLLFLGVITLVSGGMEQTTQEVARRIDTLGERLVRIEHAAAASHGEPQSREDLRQSPH